MLRRCARVAAAATKLNATPTATCPRLALPRCLCTTAPLRAAAAGTTSFSNPYMHVETDAKGVTVLSFQNPPVNVVSTDFLVHFNSALELLRTPFSADKTSKNNEQNVTRALIITSAVPNAFVAGLDLAEMIDPQEEAYLRFRFQVAKNWSLLLNFPTPLLTVITGQCPGQGTVIAVMSDYRVMVEASSKPGGRPFRIGLNEAAIGLLAPRHSCEAFTDIIHNRNVSYDMLLRGTMVTAREAHTIGLVDAYAADKEAAMALARAKAETYVPISPAVLRELRRQFKGRYCYLDINDPKAVDAESRVMLQRVREPQIQAVLKGYVQQLGAKKKKK